MAMTVGYLLLLVALTGVYATRSNICLISGGSVYTPLQLYPQDCPNNASNCMAAVYKYNATLFKYTGPQSLYPNVRESWVYMTQDESDNLDVVVITATSYTNNIIGVNVSMTGAAPGANTIVRDDANDTWAWNPSNNSGNFLWNLQPGYTDGVVLGHFQLIDNYCFRVSFKPNWNGAISNVVFLTGTVAAPIRKIVMPLSTNSTYFEFCQYPQALITSTDASCSGGLGSASATSLYSPGLAKYKWTSADGTTVGVTSSVSNLVAGVYTLALSIGNCTATRTVTINLIEGSCPKTCPPGTITYGNDCAGCPAGTYSSANNSVSCTVCPPGTWNNVANATSCNTCTANTVSIGGQGPCTDCPVSTSSAAGDAICAPCPLGTDRDSGVATCTTCVTGSVRCTPNTLCTACSQGTYASSSSHLCVTCAPGMFANSTGQTSCSQCPANSYAAAGSASCSTCSVGTSAPAGSAVLLACM